MASNNLNFDTLKIWGCRVWLQNRKIKSMNQALPYLLRIPNINGFCLECYLNLKKCSFEVWQIVFKNPVVKYQRVQTWHYILILPRNIIAEERNFLSQGKCNFVFRLLLWLVWKFQDFATTKDFLLLEIAECAWLKLKNPPNRLQHVQCLSWMAGALKQIQILPGKHVKVSWNFCWLTILLTALFAIRYVYSYWYLKSTKAKLF